MPLKSPKAELTEVRDSLRRLRRREGELLALLADEADRAPKAAQRPGWPVQRLSESRPN